VHCVDATQLTPPPSAAPSSSPPRALPRASKPWDRRCCYIAACPSPVLAHISLGPLFISVNPSLKPTTPPTNPHIKTSTNPTFPAQTHPSRHPIPDPEPHSVASKAPRSHQPTNQQSHTTPNHPQKWPTKDPKALRPPTLPKPTTPAPTSNPATARHLLPWAAQVPTALRPVSRTTMAASSKATTSRPCNTSSSPCTLSRAILRRANIRTIEDGVARVVRVFVRVSWVRWLVVVVWIVCSKELENGGSIASCKGGSTWEVNNNG